MITITASEIAECEYCEISWKFSKMLQDDVSKKLSIKGSIAHSEHIRAEKTSNQLIRWKKLVKIIITLLTLGVLIYLLYFLWR